MGAVMVSSSEKDLRTGTRLAQSAFNKKESHLKNRIHEIGHSIGDYYEQQQSYRGQLETLFPGNYELQGVKTWDIRNLPPPFFFSKKI